MPRPTKPRWVEFSPHVTYFKPAGVPMSQLQEIRLGVDEAEALRLKDLVGLEQENCAKRMNLAQSTFQRLLTSARRKVSAALIQGKAISISGGNYEITPRSLVCDDCTNEWINKRRDELESSCPACGSQNISPEAGPTRRRRRGRGLGNGRGGQKR